VTYLPNIPAANDRPSQSQSQIQGNFQQIDTGFARNHIALTNGNAADRGKHTFVTLTRQAGNGTTGATEGSLFTKVAAATTQLFWRYQNNGPVIQISNSVVPAAVPPRYTTWLPGGMLIQTGRTFVPASAGSTIINFPIAFDSANVLVLVCYFRATNSNNTVSVDSNINSATQFGVFNSDPFPHDVNWMAIGLKT
jgi:hypothetical protein